MDKKNTSIKKLIGFYPCPYCHKNIFSIYERGDKLYLKANITRLLVNGVFPLRNYKTGFVYYVCRECGEKSWQINPEFELQEVLIDIVQDYIEKNPQGEKFNEIWQRFLQQQNNKK